MPNVHGQLGGGCGGIWVDGWGEWEGGGGRPKSEIIPVYTIKNHMIYILGLLQSPKKHHKTPNTLNKIKADF